MNKRFWTTLSCAILILPAAPALGAEIRVAAAAHNQEILREIAQRFERKTGHRVGLIFGASGKFFAQILQGAPFDLYFSADQDYPKALFEKGLSEVPVRYARGRLVLWVPDSSPLDFGMKLGVLRDPRIRRVAIANPKVSPYGRVAMEIVEKTKLHGLKFAMAENVSQASQFVESGDADIGFLPLSLAISPKLACRGKHWVIPASSHRPIDSSAVLLKHSNEKGTAREFLDYVVSPEVRETWRRYGYEQ